MSETDPTRRPIGFVVVMTLVALYMGIRLVEGVVCVSNWLFDAGTCPW